VGAAGAEHRLRPGGGWEGGGGNPLGTRGRRDRPVGARGHAGALVADITCRSATQMVTVRPGMLPAPEPAPEAERPQRVASLTERVVGTRGRVRVLAEHRNDDVETLARAQAPRSTSSSAPWPPCWAPSSPPRAR